MTDQSPDPETVGTLHDYILAFGMVSLNYVYLESRLRSCLRDMERVRALWPLTPKTRATIQALYAKSTLGGLVTAFERQKGPEALVTNLRELVTVRNQLLHNVYLLSDIQERRIPLDRVQERTSDLNILAERVGGRMQAVMKYGHPVSQELARLQTEHDSPPTWLGSLERLGEMVKDYPDA